MVSDLVLCDACAAANAAWAAGTRGTFDAGDCHIYRTDQEGYTILAAAGSEQFEDWIVDLMAGWRSDASAVLPLIRASNAVSGELYLTGHSKGGGDIIELADLLKRGGIVIIRLVTFEAPITGAHPGLRPAIPGSDYAHHGDGVPLVPLGHQRPQPLTWFPDPALPESSDLFANHHLLTAVRPALVKLLST